MGVKYLSAPLLTLVFLIATALLANCAVEGRPLIGQHAAIPWDLYHKTDDILGYMQQAAKLHQDLARYEMLGPLPVLTLTNLSVPTPPGDGDAGDAAPPRKLRLLVVFGEHAREIITSELALWFARLLLEEQPPLVNWPAFGAALATSVPWIRAQVMTLGTCRGAFDNGAVPAARNACLHEWFAVLLSKCELKMVAVEMAGQRRKVEAGQLCVRTNARNVDLNRNWSFQWRPGRFGEEDFGGTGPFTEMESVTLRQLAEQWRPDAYINVHSGEYALYYPWDHKKEMPQASDGLPPDMADLFKSLNAHCQCENGAAGAASGYLAYGTSMDYLFQHLHVPYAMTFEIYGPGNRGRGGVPLRRRRHLLQRSSCFREFNPSSAMEYQRVISDWSNILLLVMDHLAATHVLPEATDKWLATSSVVAGVGTSDARIEQEVNATVHSYGGGDGRISGSNMVGEGHHHNDMGVLKSDSGVETAVSGQVERHFDASAYNPSQGLPELSIQPHNTAPVSLPLFSAEKLYATRSSKARTDDALYGVSIVSASDVKHDQDLPRESKAEYGELVHQQTSSEQLAAAVYTRMHAQIGILQFFSKVFATVCAAPIAAIQWVFRREDEPPLMIVKAMLIMMVSVFATAKLLTVLASFRLRHVLTNRDTSL